jgi:hypothetical protein
MRLTPKTPRRTSMRRLTEIAWSDGYVSYRGSSTYSEACVFVDGTDSALGFWNLWPIRKERNEVPVFHLGLLERMFRIPRIGNGKFCARYVIRIWISINESVQEGSSLSKGLAQQ